MFVSQTRPGLEKLAEVAHSLTHDAHPSSQMRSFRANILDLLHRAKRSGVTRAQAVRTRRFGISTNLLLKIGCLTKNEETVAPRLSHRLPNAAPRVKRTASVPAPSVRERLLAAAMELVKSEGMQGLSQARVAAAAGLRQSHLTYYFPTRKDLMQALVQAIHAGMRDAIQPAPSTQPARGKPTTSVNKLREVFAQRIREPILARMMLALILAAEEDPSLRRWLIRFDDELLDGLRDAFAELGLRPSNDELALLHASLVGAAILSVQRGSRAASDHAAQLARLAFDRLLQTTSRNNTKSRRSTRATPRRKRSKT